MIEDLYQELIIDHARFPQNRGSLAAPSHSAHQYNPLCGDEVTLQLLVENGVIQDIAFEGQGCAISTAATSIMTTLIKGKTTEEAKALGQLFRDKITGNAEIEDLGELEALVPIKEYPMRVKCATLPWHALLDALRSETT